MNNWCNTGMKYIGKFKLNYAGITDVTILQDELMNPRIVVRTEKPIKQSMYIEQFFEFFPELLPHKKGILNQIGMLINSTERV